MTAQGFALCGLIVDAHESIMRSVNARSRRLQLKHARRASEILHDALCAIKQEPSRIPETALFPTAPLRGPSDEGTGASNPDAAVIVL